MSVLDIAISQLGVEEEPRGSNWGERVEEYLDSVGIHAPNSWCMAFVYWCVKIAYDEKLIPLHRTGGVLDQWNNTPLNSRSKTPEVGDVFIMDFGKGKGHTGFVERVESDRIHTIEGNATDDNQGREGYEVCRKVRRIDTMKGFIKLPQPSIIPTIV